jgi:AraC family transcriptional regulator
VRSEEHTSRLFTTDLARKHAFQVGVDRSPLVQSEQLPDTNFKRAIGNRILLEHRFHHIGSEVPECSPIKAGLVINLGEQYQVDRWIDGKFYHDRIQRGDFTLFPSGISYRVIWDRPIELLMVGFEPSLIEQTALELNYLGRLQFSGNCDREILPQYKLNDLLIYQIGLALKAELYAHGSIDSLYTESMVNTLLVHLLKCHSSQSNSATSTNGLPAFTLDLVLEYIHEHLAENISLAELAAIAQMSPHHFGNQFKRSIGQSPYRYIMQQRLERAQELLKNTNRSIVDIATESGFANQSHLTTLFSKHLSITPKKYRQLL